MFYFCFVSLFSIFLLCLHHFIKNKNKFLTDFSIKSYFSETIDISCPQLGISIVNKNKNNNNNNDNNNNDDIDGILKRESNLSFFHLRRKLNI